MAATTSTRPVEGLLSTMTAASMAGVTNRQLDYWVRIGVIEPEISATGPGSHRRFAASQAPALRLVGHLMRMGAEARIVGRTARHLANYDFAARPKAFVIVSADGAAVQHLAVGLAEEVRLNGPCWVVPVAACLPIVAAVPARSRQASAAGERAGTGAAGPDRDSGDDTAPDATGGGSTQRGAGQTAQGAA